MFEEFAERLRRLSSESAKSQNETTSLPPAWINGWKSPWSDKQKGGELLPRGGEELYDLAQRLRMRYPEIFSEKYHPDVYPIIATQVSKSEHPDMRYVSFIVFETKQCRKLWCQMKMRYVLEASVTC